MCGMLRVEVIVDVEEVVRKASRRSPWPSISSSTIVGKLRKSSKRQGRVVPSLESERKDFGDKRS